MNRIFSIAILSLGMACTNGKPETQLAATQLTASQLAAGPAIQIDTAAAECPYLTKDNKGNTVLSWVRMYSDSTTAFCYASSTDGKTFSSPVVIPNTGNIQPHGENLPKILFKPSGEIIALWGASNPNPKNKYSGLVFYTQSFDQGKTWSDVRNLVSLVDSYDQRYYDVAILPNGEAGIIWLDNRKTTTKVGSGLYFASTHGRGGFEGGKLISQPCCQCCRTDLFVDKKGGIHALFRGIVQDSVRDMVHIVSTDGGENFTDPKRISEDNWVINGCPHTGPAMAENSAGIHFAWFTGGKDKGCFYTKSTDNGKSFQKRDSISAFGSHPQLSSTSNGDLLIVWDESTKTGNTVGKKIGIQKRTAEGEAQAKEYITAAEAQASYPVIAAVNDHTSIVAYSIRSGNQDVIKYQLVNFK